MNELPIELVNIVEPVQVVTQAPHYGLLIMTLVALAIGSLAGVYWWLKNKHRRRTLQRLRRLQRDFRAGRVTAHALAYDVAAALRNYLQSHRLHANQIKEAGNDSQRAAWRSFVARLDTARYQPGHELNPAQVTELLREAAVWARQLR
jgi:hypothetical protein